MTTTVVFHRMRDDVRLACWSLSPLHTSDRHRIVPGALRSATEYQGEQPLHASVQAPGMRVDVTMSADAPIVTADTAERLRPVVGSDARYVPVIIDGEDTRYFAMNVLRACDCVDEERSIIEWHRPGTTITGSERYQLLSRIRIHPAAVPGNEVFRPLYWPAAIIVSDSVRLLLESHETTGVAFEPT